MNALLIPPELSLVQDALNVGPEDQSLWFYHQFLILNLTERSEGRTIVPALTTAERASYLARDMDFIRDLLEDYDDIKWIYEALLECTLAKPRVERRDMSDAERTELSELLEKLRKLDPMRNGRWKDIGDTYILRS